MVARETEKDALSPTVGRYYRPATVAECCMALQQPGAKALAGGTDIMPLIHDRCLSVETLVDIAQLPELRVIKHHESHTTIGAAVRVATVEAEEVIAAKLRCLTEAAGWLGAPSTRQRATVGGNLCNASPACDLAPPLLALGAILDIVSEDCARRVPLEKFFTGVNQTILEPGEIVRSVDIAHPPVGAGSAFIKLGRRNALTLAVVNTAVYLEQRDGTILDARIAIGAVAPTPLRATEAESLLIGTAPDEEGDALFADIARSAAAAVRPISDARASKRYRQAMTETLVERALATAWQRARHEPSASAADEAEYMRVVSE